MVQIEVRDNGSGMTEQVRNSLLSHFLQPNQKEQVWGNMVHSIVQGTKGNIVVQSKIGEGSSFIQIPYEHRTLNTMKVSKSIEIQFERRSQKTILIVDDNDDVRNILIG